MSRETSALLLGAAILVAATSTPSLAQTLVDTLKITFPDVVLEKALKAAENSDPSAQFIVGTLYYTGRNATRDYREAARWYENAADQGIHWAQVILGQMYYEGAKVPTNYEKSLKFFRLAIQMGIPEAQFGIGRMYLEGKGVTVDVREATRWLEKAALQGHTESQQLFGDILADGKVGNKDVIEAYKWYCMAATGGQSTAAAKRDKLQKELTPIEISRAQDRAALFKTVSNYYQTTLDQQLARIQAIARELEPVKEEKKPTTNVVTKAR